jgi:hypothetical protein
MKRAVATRSVVLVFGILCMALSGFAQSPQVQYNPDFPRLGMCYIGGDQTYPSSSWPIMAKFNVVVMGAGYENWGNANRTRESRVDAIHSLSKVGTKVFQYVEFESANNPTYSVGFGTGAGVPKTSYVSTNDGFPHFTFNYLYDYSNWQSDGTGGRFKNNWWLYNHGSAKADGTIGPEIVSGGQKYVLNITKYVVPDPATGFTPFQAAADYSYHEFIVGDVANQPNTQYNGAPGMDGIYLDNCWWAPMQAGDWNIDGTTDPLTGQNGYVVDPTIMIPYRQANAEFAQTIHSESNGQKLAICNNGNWPMAASGATPPQPPSNIGPLYQQYEGGVDEAVIGASFSKETYAGFNVAMQYYTDLMAMVANPKLEIFNQEGLKADGSDSYDSTPHKAIRYGISMALMNDGYYAPEVAPSHIGPSFGSKVWWDEFDAGGLGQGYLGQPVRDARGVEQTGPRWNYGPSGVWAREFENGIAIVNPKGNGSVTLTAQELCDDIWKHFLGTEDPVTNNGEDVTDGITLADRDGVILLRRNTLRTITLQLSSTQLVYPGATNVKACVDPNGTATATGQVGIYDGSTLLTTQTLQGDGCAYWYISPGLSAGTHSITAAYVGGGLNAPEPSVATTVTVNPVPVNMSASCWNSSFAYGANYQCTVNLSSNAGAVQGGITYTLDGGAPVSLVLSNGNAQFIIAKPSTGNHQVTLAYAQQTNYAAATPQTKSFTVTPAAVNVALTPSTYYTSVGTTISFTAAVTSWSAGAPATGAVSFYDGDTLLSTVPVGADGKAVYSTASLSSGMHTISATFAGAADYASASSSATIQLH